jgi:prepilin-type N-terminal cleavage/methylation domain-containing protein
MSERRATTMHARSRGFSLVEMMVVMLLFSIVVAGIFSTVVSIGHAQAASTRVQLAQSAVRAALERITRDVQMASAGSATGLVWFANGAPASRPAVSVTDSTSGPDRLDLILIDPTAQATVVAPFAAAGTQIVVDSTANFRVGDLVELTDLSVATVYQVTGLGASGGSPALNVIAAGNALPQGYAAGSLVFRSKSISYFVDTLPFGNYDPVLEFDPDGAGPLPAQPIAEGIEDLQVALGFDLNGDGALTQSGLVAGDDEWIYDVGGEVAPGSLVQLRSVRVTLIGRSTASDVGTRGLRPAVEDHPSASAGDAYPRRVLRSEVAVRNFNL